MTLYDPENPDHVARLEGLRRSWTPEKEAALQQKIANERASRERVRDRI